MRALLRLVFLSVLGLAQGACGGREAGDTSGGEAI
jgi:hypothetical protein